MQIREKNITNFENSSDNIKSECVMEIFMKNNKLCISEEPIASPNYIPVQEALD
jgi:hypothetical protein